MSSPTQLLRLPLKDTLRLSRVQIQPATPLSQTSVLCGPLGPPRLSPTSTSSSAFSTRAALLNGKSPGNGSSKPRSSDAEKAGSEQHEDPLGTPSFSLESLGIGRNMKMFLLAVLCVFGTAETWFWCKAIWTWWKGGEKKEGEEEVE